MQCICRYLHVRTSRSLSVEPRTVQKLGPDRLCVQAGAATPAGGDLCDGLDAAMQQTAGPAPLQPHVDRAAFAEACAAYEPPRKPGRPAPEQAARDKKEAQVRVGGQPCLQGRRAGAAVFVVECHSLECEIYCKDDSIDEAQRPKHPYWFASQML